MAINFPDPSQQTTYVADSGVTYEFIDGVWKATTFAGLGDVRYVNITGDDMSGNLTIATDKVSLNTDGSASFAGTVDVNALTVDGAAIDTSAEVDAKVATKTTEAYVNQQIAAIPPTDLSAYDTSAEVTAKVAALETSLTDGAPGALDTLNELAASLGDDSNFAGTVTNSLAGKADLSGATFTGDVTASAFIGDGSQLTGVGSETIISSTPPTPADYEVGTMWWNSDSTDTALYILYQDPTGPNGDAGGKYWVEAAPAPDSIGFNGSHTGDSTFSGDMTVIGAGTFTSNVGIGNTGPDSKLHVKEGTVSGKTTVLTLEAPGTVADDGPAIDFIPNGSSVASASIVGARPDGSGTDGYLGFYTNNAATNSEKMRLDSSGRLLLGASSALTGTNAQFSRFVVQGASSGSAFDGRISLSRGTAASSLAAGSTVGSIYFTDISSNEFAAITATVDGTTGAADAPGRLVFATTEDGASTPTERMRIDSNGFVKAKAGRFLVQTSDSGTGDTDGLALLVDGNTDAYVWNYENTSLRFGTNNTEAMRIDSDGRLGVGTNSPEARLEVAGAGATVDSHTDVHARLFDTSAYGQDVGGKLIFSGKINSTGTAAGFGAIHGGKEDNTNGANRGYLRFFTRGNGGNPAERMRIDSSGRVGIGTLSPTGALTIDADGDATQLIIKRTTSAEDNGLQLQDQESNTQAFFNLEGTSTNRLQIGSSNEIAFFTNSTFGGPPSNERLRIDSQGRVGIGTSLPTEKLFVNDSSNNAAIEIRTGGAAFNAVTRFNADSTNYASVGLENTALVFRCSNSSTPAERMRIDSSGRVGIGTLSPSTVNTNGFVVNPIGNGTNIPFYGNGGASTSNSHISVALYSTSAGNYRFYVGYGGTVYARSTSISALSDEREKLNIRNLDTGLAEILQLQPRRFDWRDGSGTDIPGFVAQEVEGIFPELIEDYNKTETETRKALRMGDILPTLVNAIKELSAKVETLEAEIAALKAS